MVKQKKLEFKTIALSTNKKNEDVMSIASQCYEVLSRRGITVLVDKGLSMLGLRPSSQKIIQQNSDLLIAIGGDGTMLNCARTYGPYQVPILGINLGILGFLNDIAPKDVTESLIRVIEGEYKIDKRFFLETCVLGKKKIYTALNELVIHSGEIAQLIEYEVFINMSFVYYSVEIPPYL